MTAATIVKVIPMSPTRLVPHGRKASARRRTISVTVGYEGTRAASEHPFASPWGLTNGEEGLSQAGPGRLLANAAPEKGGEVAGCA